MCPSGRKKVSDVCVLVLIYLIIEAQETGAAYSREFLLAAPPVNFSLANAVPTDINYYLHTSEKQENWTVLTTDNVSQVEFDRNLPTKVFIHGFTTDETSPWYPIMKTEYFKRGPHNIIYIDWSRAGNQTFSISSANVNPVGEYMADFLIASEIPANQIHLIGHSLGSHLAGFVGKHYFRKHNKKIARITGLDTGGPCFHKNAEALRLCPNDAEFVDSIHTDIGYYGLIVPHGHVDFYPNFGKNQPGCMVENCSHARSTLYFAESINSRTIKAVQVNYLAEDDITVISGGKKIVFGDATPTNSTGNYYLRTNSMQPYLNPE